MLENKSQSDDVPARLTPIYGIKFYCGIRFSSNTLLDFDSNIHNLIRYVREGKHDRIFYTDDTYDGFYLLYKRQCSKLHCFVKFAFEDLFKEFNVKLSPKINVFTFT
jgi:hypothetical protein